MSVGVWGGHHITSLKKCTNNVEENYQQHFSMKFDFAPKINGSHLVTPGQNNLDSAHVWDSTYEEPQYQLERHVWSTVIIPKNITIGTTIYLWYK